MPGMLSQMIDYTNALNTALAAGETLRVISRLSYDARENHDADTLYLAWADSNGSEPIRLRPAPLTSQQELFAFFTEKAAGSKLPRYTLNVTASRALLIERLGPGPDNVRIVAG